jgi:hypothetical protein
VSRPATAYAQEVTTRGQMTAYRYLALAIPCWLEVRDSLTGPSTSIYRLELETWPPKCITEPRRLREEAAETGHNTVPKLSDLAIGANVDSYAASEPLKGMSWSEWLARCRADEVRGAERRMKVVKGASIALFLGVAALWHAVGPCMSAR